LLAATGRSELYLSDLDAIRSGNYSIYIRDLIGRLTVPALVDCGGLPIYPWKHVRSVIPSESKLKPQRVRGLFEKAAETAPPAFSLDLLGGRLLAHGQDWELEGEHDAMGLVERAYEIGFRTIIVLDLAYVGSGQGVVTGAICRSIREAYSDMELLTGGGIRGWDDIRELGECGVDGVLVSSAIHDGSLTFPPPDS
jgi:phosphoribosylformimino-5-aminoimidazole carboxamide ribotide isomerase